MKKVKDEKILRAMRDYHGGAWAWVRTRPSSHWIWRIAGALGEEGLKFLPKIINEFAGFRGYPSRRVLKFYELRDELDRNWPKYQDKSVNEIISLLEKEIGLHVTSKFIYSVFIQMGRTPPTKTPKKPTP
jgi:hypothetical protein